ncbi:MAG: fumarylacetoacetate hydrolase family protein [Candidatus Omnitrophica bacterium]|nr:fumarylacetoacetate hydrolase family protein [Candidatus Omnitrophota bacterium]
MKYIRYEKDGVPCRGIIENGIVAGFELSDVRILPPASPTKIVAVGLNYIDHAKELNMGVPIEPLLFIKPPSSIIGPSEIIYYPPQAKRVDYEAELAIVIKKKARNISAGNAEDFILGYTCLNDVTARDLQKKDGQWTRAKSFDTFCPIGPHIETDLDTSSLKIELLINEEVRQSSSTSNMIFDCKRLVEFISSVMTLEPEDIIATGTPPGVGPISVGDKVEVRIQGIGSLVNSVGIR